ncbi:MAG TPA: redox-sensing transcriptional repressor Rex [Candidatus Ornithoclostridium faecigallinarum]|nr:redox-sensing transcriptional repressor Rex [Candidatus Ornithoclostridium faecigallinarum]
MGNKVISEAVIKRLPRYYRYLEHLEQEGVSKVSSGTLASLLGVTASQVRQDFCNFGGFGQHGYGYDVGYLKRKLAEILGLDRQYDMIIVGAGNIGRALAGYKNFAAEGFKVRALFDIEVKDPFVGDVPVYKIDKLAEYVKEHGCDIAVIATQKNVASDVASQLVALGVKSLWNFAPIDLEVPKDVAVENIAMSESLYVLSYRMKNQEK